MLSSWADGTSLVFRLVQRMTSFHTGGGCRQERTRKICCLPYGEEALQTGSGENAVLPFQPEFRNWNRCRKFVSNFVPGIRGINEIRRQFMHIRENLPLSD